MKKYFAVIGMILACNGAMAGPGVLVGISYNFGGSVGLTLKVLSSKEEDHAVAAVGVSYFPMSKERKLGLDVGAGYTFKNGAVTIGWDFLGQQAQVGLGYLKTKDERPAPAAAATPAPAPIAPSEPPACVDCLE